MTKQYVKEQKPAGPPQANATGEQAPNYHMWIRLGAVDGMRYLAKHFQIVIFNKDTQLEDLGSNFSQVALV